MHQLLIINGATKTKKILLFQFFSMNILIFEGSVDNESRREGLRAL